MPTLESIVGPWPIIGVVIPQYELVASSHPGLMEVCFETFKALLFIQFLCYAIPCWTYKLEGHKCNCCSFAEGDYPSLARPQTASPKLSSFSALPDGEVSKSAGDKCSASFLSFNVFCFHTSSSSSSQVVVNE